MADNSVEEFYYINNVAPYISRQSIIKNFRYEYSNQNRTFSVNKNHNIIAYKTDVKSLQDYYLFGMIMLGRNFNSTDYRFGFQSMEKDDEIFSSTGTSYTAEFWQYDSRTARRWNVDPVVKHDQSGYSAFANNPIWIIDPNGADSLFYNNAGDEINRIKADGDHTHFVSNKDGNKLINGSNYYQGLTKASLFGDRDSENQGLFSNVDKSSIKNNDAVKNIVNKNTPNDESVINFLSESRHKKKYDYKNSKLLTKGKDNSKTAYMYNGILYNRNEAGNLLWGASSAKVGLASGAVWFATHGYSMMTELSSDEYGEQRSVATGRAIMGIRDYLNRAEKGFWGSKLSRDEK